MTRPGERRGGRKPGSRNKRALDGEAYARAIVEDAQVQAQLLQQAQAGILPSEILKTLLAYAYGKPVEVVDSGDSATPRTIQITF